MKIKKVTPLIIFCLLLFAGLQPIHAATITVTSTTDGDPGSLREAVSTAVAGDVIEFAVSTNGTVQMLSMGEIVIDKSITIVGNGSTKTLISGGSASRIFNITGDPVSISKLTLQNGLATDNGGAILMTGVTVEITNCMIKDNIAGGAMATQGGGGIYNDGGTLTILVSTISNNQANGASGSGGGIFNGTNGNLNIQNSSISGNSAMRAGGGIEDNSGAGTTINLLKTDFIDNTTSMAPGNGGGLHITGAGNAFIRGGMVSGNKAAAEGGGLWNGTGTMTGYDVTIDNNTASGAGADQGGGGVFNAGGTVFIDGATISNNKADGASGSGGGILNDVGGNLEVKNSIISMNSSMRAGGGIEDNSGVGTSFYLSEVNLDNNSTSMAPGNGGGLHITGAGDASIFGGTVNGNTAAAEGGGLWNGTGNMHVENVMIDNNTASGAGADQGGGGVFNAGGTVFIDDSTISNNKADGASGSGGGILNDAGGTFEIRNSSLTTNTAMRAGGGIEDNSGAGLGLTLRDVDLMGNSTGSAPGNGGGLHITGPGDAFIFGGTVSGNKAAAEGGGLWNGTGTMDVQQVLVDNNTASGAGADQGGGGVFNAGGTVSIVNSTITNNMADGAGGSGGGILNDAGGTLTVTRTKVSMNTSMRAGGGIEDNSGAGSLVSLIQVNLDDNTTSMSPGNGGGLHITGPGNARIFGGTANGNMAAAEGGGLWNGTGSMTVENITIDNNTASGAMADQGGGGVFNAGGTLFIDHATITGNKADGASGSGGGVLNDAGGTLTIHNSTISVNTAARAGGGIEDNSGAGTTVSLRNVLLNNNTTGSAPGNGGGLHITGAGDAVITRGTVNGNMAAQEGGGLWNGSGTMTVNLVTINGNTASGALVDDGGGGIFNNGGLLQVIKSTLFNNTADGTAGAGGGIFNNGGEISIDRSTISGNQSVSGLGGGVFNSGMAGIEASTITGNAAITGGGIAQDIAGSMLTLGSTILAGNSAVAPPVEDISISLGTTSSNDYNLIGIEQSPLFTPAANDQTGTVGSPLDPMLDVLANNGGPTETHALLCGSTAIDAGDPGLAFKDQRSLAVFNGQRDIGSFELQMTCPVSPIVSNPAEESANSIGSLNAETALNASISVYPNPSPRSVVILNIPTEFGEDVSVRILDLSGQIMVEKWAAAGTNELNLSHLSAGTYLVQVITAQHTTSRRLVLVD